MRIALISVHDPRDRMAWSGGIYSMVRALRKRAKAVHYITVDDKGTLAPTLSALGLRPAARWYARNRRAVEPLPLAAQAKAIAGVIERGRYDVVFAPLASRLAAYVDCAVPLIYMSDATERAMRAYYPPPPGRSEAEADEFEACERRTLEKAQRLIYPSEWARDSAIADYGADPARIRVIPLGGNMPPPPPFEAILRRRKRDPLHIVHVGKNWRRKGGELTVQTLEILRKRGFDARLTLCGAEPPAPYRDAEGLHAVGMLQQASRADMRRLGGFLAQSAFMIGPSRAEAFGMVFCEAAAYGLPALATATGGIPTVVQDGETGFLFPLDAGPEDYADAIVRAIDDDALYNVLCRNARARYETVLNWDAWGDRFMETAAELR